MNDLIVLIIIWIVIALLNQLFKKSKASGEKTKPSQVPPGQEKEELPPVFKKLFGLPEEHPEKLEEPWIIEKTGTTILEEEEQAKNTFEKAERKKLDLLEESKKDIEEKVVNLPPIKAKSAKEMKIGRRKLTKKYENFSLRQAVVMKEILDRPLSIRHLQPKTYPFMNH